MNLNQQNIIVTGGSGFIGSHLCERLIADDNKLTLLVLVDDPLDNLAQIREQLEVIPCDLTDQVQLEKIIKQVEPQYVFHLAADTDQGRSLELLPKMINSNLVPTLNFIQILCGLPLKRFIVLGTSDIYGQNHAPCNEEMLPAPNSPYAATKAASLLFTQFACRNYQLPAVMLIPFMVYGPRQNQRMLISEAIISAIKGEDFPMTVGEQVREFNYVDDIVEGIIQAAAAEEALGEVINLCGGEKLMIAEVVEKIVAQMGNQVKALCGALPYRTVEIMNHFGDNSKAVRLLGYEAKTPLTLGLQSTIEHFKAKGIK